MYFIIKLATRHGDGGDDDDGHDDDDDDDDDDDGEIDDKAIEKSFTAEDRAKLDKMKDWEKEARTQRLRPTVAPPSRPFVSPYHRAGVPSGSVRDPQSGS